MNGEALFANYGFTDLVSVIPPIGKLTPGSRISPTQMGKVPGTMTNGLWHGTTAWQDVTADQATVRMMDRCQANIGMKASACPAVDIDILDRDLAELVSQIVDRYGEAPIRVGLPPKRLHIFRLGGAAFSKIRLAFRYGGQDCGVEILGRGQQFVIAGGHTSGREYTYTRPLKAYNDLPLLTVEKAHALMAEVAELLNLFGVDMISRTLEAPGAPNDCDQETLKAPSLEALEQLVAAIPNGANVDRHGFIKMGFAIKAAVGEQGLESYLNWATSWQGGENKRETVESFWRSFTPPFHVGWAYLQGLARESGSTTLTAPTEFEIEEAPAPVALEDTPLIRNSDIELAHQVLHEYGDRVRYAPEWASFLVWDGNGAWVTDRSETQIASLIKRTLIKRAHAVVRACNTDRERKEAYTTAREISSVRKIMNILTLLRRESRVSTLIAQWDSDAHLVGIPGGTVDLRLGQRVPSRYEHYITRSTQVSPDWGAGCPEWLKFINHVSEGDEELALYMQRVAGYCLTGETKEQVFFFIYGLGGYGKGTFINMLDWLWGKEGRGYSHVSQMSTFTSSPNDKSNSRDIASMVGARLVLSQETRADRSWDEQRVTSLTGQDRITAAQIYKEEFTYQPAFKLFFSGNFRPKIDSLSTAMQRRIHLISFNNPPASRDPDLPARLQKEAAGILAWAIDGAKSWYEGGLRMPEAVKASTEEYLLSEDRLKRWMDECCEPWAETDPMLLAASAFQSWSAWCQEQAMDKGTQTSFGTQMSNHGVPRKRKPTGTFYALKLRTDLEEGFTGEQL